MLRQRLLLGPPLILALLGVIWLDDRIERLDLAGAWRWVAQGRPSPPPGVVIFVVMLAISFLASRELARILKHNGIAASKRIITAAAIGGLLVSCLVPADQDGVTSVAIVSSAAAAALVVPLVYHSRNRSVEGVVGAAGGTLLAFVYLGLLFGFLLAIRREHSAWLLAWVLLTTKASDIGAFAAGMTLGRHKLIPWLSPGKTWEGLAGGIASSAIVGAAGVEVLRAIGDPSAPTPAFGAFCGAVFAVVGQAGDLMESLLKRDAGLKDSGDVVPGFGGVLDVIDSVLLVAPAAYWLLRPEDGTGLPAR